MSSDDLGLMMEAAASGMGLAYVPRHAARELIVAGVLRMVLGDWCPEIPGLFLYYPRHRHVPGPLRAFIDILKTTVP